MLHREKSEARKREMGQEIRKSSRYCNEGKVHSITMRVEDMGWRALGQIRSKNVKPGGSCRNHLL